MTDKLTMKENNCFDDSEFEDLNRSSSVTESSVDDEREQAYFEKETSRTVQKLRVFVLVMLFLVTVAVCLVVYFITARGQQAEFEGA